MHKVRFDREKYLTLQGEHIEAQRRQFEGKLYLEFGGKLIDDIHASRVLPGSTPGNKIVILAGLADGVGIVVVVNTQGFFRHEVRADLGISYKGDVLRHIDAFRSYDLYVGSVVISHWSNNNCWAATFERKLGRLDIKVYRHYVIPGHPRNVAHIVSPEGYRRNKYIKAKRDLMVVTAPGPRSGKMITCLSQLYHDHQQGIQSSYTEFEAFPVWNLPLDHPVNIAYEAATADLDDVNMIDHFHLAAYGEQTVNYNRNIEAFPVLKRLFGQLPNESPYQSPTDMGVNMAGMRINDGGVYREASRQEVIRRYSKALAAEHRDQSESTQSDRIALLTNKLQISREDRPVVLSALEKQGATKRPAVAIQLPDGQIIMDKTSPLLGACFTVLLDTLKALAGVNPDVKLLATEIIEPIQALETKHLSSRNPRLHTDEVLVTLSVSITHDDFARHTLAELHSIRGCDVRSTVILGPADEAVLHSLEVYVICELAFQIKRLYREY